MKKIILICLLLSISLLAVSCGQQHVYVCKDGSLAGDQQITSKKVVFHCPGGYNTLNYNSCTFEKPMTITEKLAQQKATSFVEGYARASGWNSKLVTVYAGDGNWFAQIILSKSGEEPFETLVKINGTQGVVTCEENCFYQE